MERVPASERMMFKQCHRPAQVVDGGVVQGAPPPHCTSLGGCAGSVAVAAQEQVCVLVDQFDAGFTA